MADAVLMVMAAAASRTRRAERCRLGIVSLMKR